MTKKHFEALAETIADLYWKLSNKKYVWKKQLMEVLLDEICWFCKYQNSRLDRQRFEDKVMQLVQQE